MIHKINEAISGGNQLAESYKKRAMQYHDILSRSIQEQIVQGTPGEKKIVLAR